jgi:hypothetical protein
MADFDPLHPTLPIPPLGQEPRREQPARDRQPPRPRKPPADVTDDMGDRREEPPLVDEFA